MSGNSFSGEFPVEIGQWTQLGRYNYGSEIRKYSFRCGFSQIYFYFPEYFGASNNRFSGVIPSEIGLTQLGEFTGSTGESVGWRSHGLCNVVKTVYYFQLFLTAQQISSWERFPERFTISLD